MGSPRKVVHHDYDVASRLTGLTVDGAAHASQIVYNASSQTTSLKVGLSGANQITESYAYNSQTGLLDNQTVARGGATTLLNLSYDYADANGKHTGQLTKITNNLVTSGNRNRSYSYDALGRLVQAKGGPFAAPLWSQTYTYDPYGNRTSVAASGNTARLEKPVEPKPQLPSGLLAFNSGGTLDRAPLFGPDRSVISDSPSGIRLGLTPETSTNGIWCKPGGRSRRLPYCVRVHAARMACQSSCTRAPSSLNSGVSNCPFLIFCANSMPLIVTAAFPNTLNPSKGLLFIPQIMHSRCWMHQSQIKKGQFYTSSIALGKERAPQVWRQC